MGVSGVSIFSDDVAQDVKDAWVYSFKKQGSAAKATEDCRSEMKEEFADSDDGPVCVLALALTLWKYGWLDEATRKEAMAIIDKGKGVERFAEAGPKFEKARLAEYAKVKAKLSSPQPEKKIVKINLKRAAIPECHLQVGDVFSIPLPAPNVGRGYFRVIGNSKVMREECPVVELLRVAVDVDPSKVKWATTKSIGLRNYTNTEALNYRFRASCLCDWKSRKWNRASVQVHSRVNVRTKLSPRDEDKYVQSASWEDIAGYIIPSLDRSRWPGLKEAYELYRKASVREISNLHETIREWRDKTGDIHMFTYGAAYLLIYKHGDYARAEAVMNMAKTIDPTLEDQMIQAHILCGLGHDADAEKLWKKELKSAESESKLRARVVGDEINDARAEIASRRSGKPLPVPIYLLP